MPTERFWLPASATYLSQGCLSQAIPMNLFERYLSLWVGLCILTGIALGHALPSLFGLIASLELARVNVAVGLLIWVMIISMLVKVDFGCLHELR